MATSFANLQDMLYVETRRPDLVSESTNALIKATLKFHSREQWIRDVVGVVVPLTPLFSGDARFLVPTNTSPFVRFRDVASIVEYQNPPTPCFTQYTKTELNDLLDPEYKIEKQDYYYRAGTGINIRSCKMITNAFVSYYQYPDTSQATYSSWIADEKPHMIVEEAASKIFAMIGKDSTAKQYAGYFGDNMTELQQYGIVSGRS